MNAPDLGELADRCEQATGLDRHLNLAIANAIYGDALAPSGTNHNYTASLDAALTLVPDGLDFGCGRGIDVETGPNKAVCHAWVGEREGELRFAESPALALCAAALHARAATERKA